MVRRRLLEWVVSVAIIAITAAILLPSLKGGRTRFSPDTLRWASQTEYSITRNRRILYRSEWKEFSNPVVDHLISQGYWTPQLVANPRWMTTVHWHAGARDGHTEFHRQIRRGAWIEWSKAHPEWADTLWRRVLLELRAEDESAQDRAGNLLRLAAHSSSLEDFLQAIASDPEAYGSPSQPKVGVP